MAMRSGTSLSRILLSRYCAACSVNPCFPVDALIQNSIRDFDRRELRLQVQCWRESQSINHDFQSRWFRSSFLVEKRIEVEIQSMGESITEGTMVEILKKEGDAVEEDEVIAQIETDKVTVDVKAPAAGQLVEVQVSVDDTVKVGQVVAVISEGAEGAEGSTEKAGSTEPVREQNDEHHESSQEQTPPKHGEGLEPRVPSIKFPTRMADRKRISDMAESERPKQDAAQADVQPPPEQDLEKRNTESKSQQPKKSQPWYVGKEQGTKLSQSRVLTQREMEQIELGGAEP